MSNVNDGLKLKGKLTISLNDDVVQEVDNLVVTAGKEFVASSILKTTSNSPAAMTHMAIGSGTNNPAAGDTALQTELGRVVTNRRERRQSTHTDKVARPEQMPDQTFRRFHHWHHHNATTSVPVCGHSAT